MAAISPRPPAVAEAVEEITRIYRSLPPRPSIEQIEAATAVITSSNCEEEAKIADLSQKVKPFGVPDELFFLLQEVARNAIQLFGVEQRRDALHLLDLDRRFRILDELIQRASRMVSGEEGVEKEETLKPVVGLRSPRRDEILLGCSDLPKELGRGSSLNYESLSGKDTEKLSLIMVASLIETSAKKGAGVLDLQGKLMDQIEWLPTSLGKLQDVIELNLSENRIIAIPPTIGSLRFLTKLDIHSNQLSNLPDSIGELCSLVDLDLRSNKLISLPTSIGNLTNLANLDLSCNQLSTLPDTLGKLNNLRRLILETNELEELPFTIGSCLCLVELRLDFNNLKALPEAVGKLESLEILTLHYNRIKSLPTTMASLYKLKELDVSFNELESVPESLCFATNLVKLDIGRNFADLSSLPRSIGNLENLEELDISSNQIKVLPDSFRYLSKLRVLLADETPLEVPPREIVKLGAQAVVQYMADLIAARQAIPRPAQKKSLWSWIFSVIFCLPKNKSVTKP